MELLELSPIDALQKKGDFLDENAPGGVIKFRKKWKCDPMATIFCGQPLNIIMDILEQLLLQYLWESMRNGRIIGRDRAGAGKFF